MSNFTMTKKIVILIIAIVLVLGFGYKIILNDRSEIELSSDDLFLEEDSETTDIEESKKIDTVEVENGKDLKEGKESKEVVVHVTGEVLSPGIVVLEDGGRVIDAIKKAGGLTPEADEKNINLAQKLFDEDKVTIPNRDEMHSVAIEKDSLETSVVSSKDGTRTSENSSTGGLVDINTADKEQLKTLSGIGDVTAQKIIDHRESSPFATIEDIKNVSGIGDKKFDAIKDMITTR